jgi:hypothetical protein
MGPPGCAQAHVQVEGPTHGRSRIADVMVTFPGGDRVALEVQYAGLSVLDWQSRRADYARAGIRDVWLFGHTPPHLRQPRRRGGQSGTQGQVLLGELHRALASAGSPVLWLNPVELAIGTAIIPPTRRIGEEEWNRWWEPQQQPFARSRLPLIGDREASLWVDSLVECALTPGGLISPAMRQVHEETARPSARAAAHAADLAAAKEQERAAAVRRAQAEHAAKQGRKEYAKQAQERDLQVWMKHPLRARIIAARGRIPDFLAERLPFDWGVRAYHEHWHCVLFDDLVVGHVGDVWPVRRVYAALDRCGFELHPDGAMHARAARGWLFQLRKHGFVHFEASGWEIRSPVAVVAGLDGSTQAPTSS